MLIQVNKDNVKILDKPNLHKGEYGLTKCEFEFSSEYNGLVKIAVFKYDYSVYKVDIINNICDIPSEVLENTGDVILGVYAYVNDNETLLLRYSPVADSFNVGKGSYTSGGKTPVQITPTQYEMYSQACNDAINEVRAVGEQLLEDKANGVFKGDKGDAGAIKMRILEELPSVGADDTLYFIKIADPTDNNLYEEWVWVNNDWEPLGNKNIEIDLTDYQKKSELEEKDLLVTYEDASTETIKLVAYK